MLSLFLRTIRRPQKVGLLSFVLAALLLQSCASDRLVNRDSSHSTANLELSLAHPDARFIVLGDWGNYGKGPQRRVAAQMDSLAGRERVDFILSTGDNIYDKGVQSVADPLWDTAFESVYGLPNLRDLTWYATLGNHDYQGNYQAQLDYSAVNPRWVLPHTYYAINLRYQGGNASLILTDTNAFKAHYHRRPEKYIGVDKQDVEAQRRWFNAQLSATKPSDWRLVVGHHPLYSTGKYRNDKEMIEAFEPALKKHKVHAYFSGHDHSLQHQKPAGVTHYFVSGAGAKLRTMTEPQEFTQFAESKLGFAYVVMSADKLKVSFIGEQGKVLHSTTLDL